MRFVIGVLLWGISFSLWFLLGQMIDADVPLVLDLGVGVLAILGALAVILACDRGWGWHPEHERLKTFAIVLIGMTVVGAVFLFYWTGKGAVQVYHDLRTDLPQHSDGSDGRN